MTPSPGNPSSSGKSATGYGKHEAAGRVATLALLTALALIFSYVEAVLPYTPGLPGVKLGIANIVVVFCLYRGSIKEAAAVNAMRIVLAGLLFNGLFAALYAAAGAMLSLLGMGLLKRTRLFSMVGVSMAGGVLHNLGQLVVAALFVEDLKMFYYFPVLLFSGLISGILTGVIAALTDRKLPKGLRLTARESSPYRPS